MKTYDYTKFKKCFLGSNFEGNFDEIFSTINKGLKKQVEKKVHPKELERQERLKKREAEMRTTLNQNPHGLFGHLHQENAVPQMENQVGILRNELRGYADDRQPQKKMKMPTKFYTYNDSVIIILGSCGFGTKEFSYFEKKLSPLNDILAKNNCHVLFVRGNNEDPSYFDEEKINFSNIKTLVSNCIVAFNTFNCLCVGGGLSMDREWRKNKGKDFGTSYWENEDVVIDWDDMKKTIENTKIACVISHQIPTFAHPVADNQNRWIKNDPDLGADMVRSRLNMDLLYTEFIKNDNKPFVWWNTYPGSPAKQSINNISFRHENSAPINLLNDIVYEDFRIFLVEEDNPFKTTMEELSKYAKKIASDYTITTTFTDPFNDVAWELHDPVIEADFARNEAHVVDAGADGINVARAIDPVGNAINVARGVAANPEWLADFNDDAGAVGQAAG